MLTKSRVSKCMTETPRTCARTAVGTLRLFYMEDAGSACFELETMEFDNC